MLKLCIRSPAKLDDSVDEPEPILKTKTVLFKVPETDIEEGRSILVDTPLIADIENGYNKNLNEKSKKWSPCAKYIHTYSPWRDCVSMSL